MVTTKGSDEVHNGVYLMFLYVTIGGADGCIGRVCGFGNYSIDCIGGIVDAGIVLLGIGSTFVDCICSEGSRREL